MVYVHIDKAVTIWAYCLLLNNVISTISTTSALLRVYYHEVP